MKRIMYKAVLAIAVVIPLIGSMAAAQEMEIPVIFDRSYFYDAPSGTDPSYAEWSLLLAADLRKDEIALSPDGQWLAFLGRSYHALGGIDIWIVPVAGGEPEKVYTIPEDELYFFDPSHSTSGGLDAMVYLSSISFTPDGEEITFCRYMPGGPPRPSEFISTIESVDLSTGIVRSIVEEGECPSWSSDGRYLTYLCENTAGIKTPAVYDTVTDQRRFIRESTNTDHYRDGIVFIADNSEVIAFNSNKLVKISIETGEESVIPVDTDFMLGELTVSPDGRYVLYTAPIVSSVSSKYHVVVLDTETDQTVWAFREFTAETDCGLITPDGGSIIYLKSYDFEWTSVDGNSSIHLSTATKICQQQIDIPVRFATGNGTVPSELPDDYGILPEFGTMLIDQMGIWLLGEKPIWSPDGQTIAYFDNDHKIWTVPADGGESICVYDNPTIPYGNRGIAWTGMIGLCGYSNDGSEILFTRVTIDEERNSIPQITNSGCHWENPLYYLYAVNVATGDVRTLIVGGSYGVYSPNGQYLAYIVNRNGIETGDEFLDTHKDQIIIRDLGSGVETFLPCANMYQHFAWTSDSESLLVYADSDEFHRVPIDGSDPEIFPIELTWRYNVDPSRPFLVYVDDDVLYGINYRTGERTQLSIPENGRYCWPSLSPDGSKMAYYVIYEGKATYNAYVTQNHSGLFCKDLTLPEEFIPTAVADVAPAAGLVIDNYPNPFNPATTISFSLPANGIARLDIYNLSGQKVRELVNDHMIAGMHEIVWNGRNDSGMQLASGLYVARIVEGSHMATQRMLLMK